MTDGVHFTYFSPWDEMNFAKNCTLWGEWYATYISPSPWNDSRYLDGDVKTIVRLFNSSLPDTWRPPDDWTMGMYYGNVLNWYGFNYYSYLDTNLNASWYITWAFRQFLVLEPWDACEKERCMALGWTGDMDLIGIGVFTSYWVEAILATALLSAYTYWRLVPRWRPFPSYKKPVPIAPHKFKPKATSYRIMVGLQESLQSFLDASNLFSIAMLIAALYMSGTGITQRVRNPEGPKVPPKTALYDMLLSMLASTFSIFPVMVVWIIKRRDPPDSINYKSRPLSFSIGITALLWVLSVIEAFMSLYGNYDYEEGEAEDTDAQEYNCDWRGSVHYWVGMKAAQYLLLACPLVLVLITVFLVTGFGFPGVVGKSFISQCRRYWRLAIAWINLLVMWGILTYFHWVRHKINRTVGHLNKTNEWRFGQWLALFTWVPFVLHVLHKWINGTDLERQQRETTQEASQKVSDGANMSRQTLETPLMNSSSHTTGPAQDRVMQMENLSTAASFPLDSEYSYPASGYTSSGRDSGEGKNPVEEWQTTGW